MKRPSLAAAIAILGGVTMAMGALLPFAKYDFAALAPSRSIGGLETLDGKLFLGVGIFLVVVGGFMWLATSKSLSRAAAFLAILAAGYMLIAAVVDIVGLAEELLDDAAVDLAAANPGLSVERIRTALEQFNVSIDTGIGLYIVLGGAALGVIGGVLGLLAKRPKPVLPAAPPPPGPPPPPIEPTAQ